jgi:hypothetical protein
MKDRVQYNPIYQKRDAAYSNKNKQIAYKIIENDVEILTGMYSGQKMSEVWSAGVEERDYIFMNLAKLDPNIMSILIGWCK